MQPAHMYDSTATMFSPDGRIYQVEYAREAVKRGSTAVGVQYNEGVLLMLDRRVATAMVEPRSIEKLFKIDSHIGCASSGLIADARVLVNKARNDAQNNRVQFGEPVWISTLTKELSDLLQSYTQNGGVRPFGTALLIGGLDPNGQPRLFETDPSGAVVAYKATAIGAGRTSAFEVLESEYREGLNLNDAAALAWKALNRAVEGSAKADTLDVAVIEKATGYRRLTSDDIKALIPRDSA